MIAILIGVVVLLVLIYLYTQQQSKGELLYTTGSVDKSYNVPSGSTVNTTPVVAPKVEDVTPTITFYKGQNFTGESKTMPFIIDVKYSSSWTVQNLCGDAKYQIGFRPESIKLTNVNKPDNLIIKLVGFYSNPGDTLCGPSGIPLKVTPALLSQLFKDGSANGENGYFNFYMRDNTAANAGYFIFSNA